LLQGQPRFQPGKYDLGGDEFPGARLYKRPLRRLRQPNVHTGEGECKALRQHADNRVGSRIDRGRFSGDAGISTEAPSPQRWADHRDRGSTWSILFFQKTASSQRLNSKDLQEVG